MWTKDRMSIEPYDEVVVKEGYIVASGVSACYGPLINPQDNVIGRSIFGDVFHIFKVNPDKPLKVRSNGYGSKLSIWPVGKEYENMMPDSVARDGSVWNASMFMFVPGDEKSLTYGNGIEKIVFPDSFVPFFTGDKKILPASLVCFYESKNVSFDGNYSNTQFSFVPPSQVGMHLFNWMTDKKRILSHEKTFEQRTAGHIEIDGVDASNALFERIAPTLKKKFGEPISFPRRPY